MTLHEMLLRLHRRLGISGTQQDELLTDLLADAHAVMLDYMNRSEMPPGLENTMVSLAAVFYNRLGTEGESARSEGDVHRTFCELPFDIAYRLDHYRVAGTVRL